MKYIVIFDDEDLKNYRTDDRGLTLVLTDKTMSTRAKQLIPMARPLAFNTDGRFAYLSDGHIDCINKYEEERSIKRMIDDISNKYFNFYGSGKYNLELFDGDVFEDNGVFKYKEDDNV